MIEGFSNNRLICLHFHQYHLRRFLGKSAVVQGALAAVAMTIATTSAGALRFFWWFFVIHNYRLKSSLSVVK